MFTCFLLSAVSTFLHEDFLVSPVQAPNAKVNEKAQCKTIKFVFQKKKN